MCFDAMRHNLTGHFMFVSLNLSYTAIFGRFLFDLQLLGS